MRRKPLITNPKIDELLRQGNVSEALAQPIEAPSEGRDRLSSFLLAPGPSKVAEDAVFGGFILGDFLYDLIRIDPIVIRGVNFARQQELSSIFGFARLAERHEELRGAAQAGSLSNYQGFVAERLVAHHYQAAGHDIVFPESSSQPGFDLLVDGQPFQVKCLDDASGVLEHLERYPEIPVIVNVELAEEVGSLPGVYVDPELMHDSVREMTEESLERGADLTDFEVPWISLGIAGALAIRDLYSGDTNLSCAVTNVLTDTAGRVVGGATGEHVTAVVGTLFFGPAGGVVGAGIGAIAGGIAGRSVARAARSLLTGKEQEAVRTRIRALAQQAAEHLPRKDEAWAEKESAIADAMVGDEGNRARIREYTLSRMRSDRAYHQNKRSEICRYTRGDNANSDVLEATSRLMVLIARAGVHPHHIQEGLRQLGECATELAKKRRRLRLG